MWRRRLKSNRGATSSSTRLVRRAIPSPAGPAVGRIVYADQEYRKLGKRTLRERIYEEVVRLIMAGELSSGGRVDEKRVIDKPRVSRTPFREVIGILAKGGLVKIKPYRGFYVRSLSRRETADLYEYSRGLNVLPSSSPYSE